MGCRIERLVTKFAMCFIFLTMLTIMWQFSSVFKYRNTFMRHAHLPTDTDTINCEMIHIGIVCSGYKSHLYLYTMMKSLYFYRNNPLYLHLVVDEVSEKVLKKLFESWDVPQVVIKFYSMKEVASRVQWVPSHHYSGIYGLLKLTFPKVIPSNITNRIIILDTDLIFTGDIYELWSFFYDFNETQVMALVENQSGYYLGTLGYKPPWPAIGKGFNSGVMLYHLERMRAFEWEKLWVTAANATAKVYGKAMGDQDIINAVVKNNSDLLYRLPCYWNTQMSDHTDSYECYRDNQIKIIHWNSPFKTKVMHKDGDNFRPVNYMFTEYNGNLLLRELQHCSVSLESVGNESPLNDDCLKLLRPPNRHWRTFLYFSPFDYKPIENDVTLVSHLTFDKIKAVEELALQWSGPMSLAFYINDIQLFQSFNFINSSTVLGKRSNIAYHTVFMEQDYYPINTLRNVALSNVVSPYVFEVDINYLPVQNLYRNLIKYISATKSMGKKALVVSSFQIKDYKKSIPKNKEEVLKMLSKEELFIIGHDHKVLKYEPKNYNWKTAQRPNAVKWKPLYQPYVVVESNATNYDERVFDIGFSKILRTMDLEAQRYEFLILPDVFIVKRPGNEPFGNKMSNQENYIKCWMKFKTQYITELNKTYGRNFNSG